MLKNDWKRDAEALLAAIDPDNVEPKYVFDYADPIAAGELTAEPGQSIVRSCGGFTWSLLDLQLRSALRARGLWRGRGFATLIDASGIEQRFAESRLPATDARRKILGIALHEFAHCVESRPPLAEQRADEILAKSAAAREWLAEPLWKGLDRVDPSPWHQHDFRYGRAAIHCWYRASRLAPQWDFLPGEVWLTTNYWLAPPSDYVDALGDEPERRAGEPLRSILTSPIPDAFREFGERDLERGAAVLAESRANETLVTENIL